MEITTETHNGVIVIGLNGRFDAYHTAAVKSALDAAVQQSPRLIVNLAQVGFMDSAALATLVQGMKYCRQLKGDLRICELQQPVKIIFELTRLDKAFNLFDTQAEAVASF